MIKKFYAFIHLKNLKEMKLKNGVFRNPSNYIHLFDRLWKHKKKKYKMIKVIVKVLKKKGG